MFGLLGELVLASRRARRRRVRRARRSRRGAADVGSCVRAPAWRRRPRPRARATRYTVDALVLGGRRDAPVALVIDERVVTVAAAALGMGTGRRHRPGAGSCTRARRGREAATSRCTAMSTEPRWHPRAGVPSRTSCSVPPTPCSRSATEYAKVREQFGQPIGAFQAVKHRLADVYVARQAASAVIGESWRSDPECTTLAAKALAGTAGASRRRTACRCSVRSASPSSTTSTGSSAGCSVLDRLYGSDRELRTALGRLLQARGRVPRPGTRLIRPPAGET